jgi:hypothetical protein
MIHANETLFPDVVVTNGDSVRLGPHLTNYNRLNEILILNNLPIEDVQKMILLELKGKSRQFILRKLVGRLKSKERKQLLHNLASCLKNPSSNPEYSDGVKPITWPSTSSSVRGAKVSRTGSRSGRRA